MYGDLENLVQPANKSLEKPVSHMLYNNDRVGEPPLIPDKMF